MKKFIGLVDVSLDANDEYYNSINDIFLGVIDAADEEEALRLLDEKWTPKEISGLGDWVQSYDYYIHVQEIV